MEHTKHHRIKIKIDYYIGPRIFIENTGPRATNIFEALQNRQKLTSIQR